LFGAPEWWPAVRPDSGSSLVAALGRKTEITDRPAQRPAEFPDAGLTFLRTPPTDGPEIWCCCDGGPHGFLSIAAHAHADALSVEVRHGGVEILADPATYCYHGEAAWRSYFRSTRAHNTIEVGGVDQSTSGGHFLWTRHAQTRRIEPVEGMPDASTWSAEHDGYTVLDPPVRHRRTVRLLRTGRQLEIRDEIHAGGSHPVRIAYHFGPAVKAHLDGDVACLTWVDSNREPATATMQLPDGVAWSLIRGGTDPVLGWYSPRFGEKEPSTTLVGDTNTARADRFTTILQFHR
jgi:hypothetical protein